MLLIRIKHPYIIHPGSPAALDDSISRCYSNFLIPFVDVALGLFDYLLYSLQVRTFFIAFNGFPLLKVEITIQFYVIFWKIFVVLFLITF